MLGICYTDSMKKSMNAFTLVELLIVVVVISLLAAISIVAYSGMLQRASDATMRVGVNQIEKAMQLWHTDTGLQPYAGSGSTGPISDDTCPGSTSAEGFIGKGGYQCTLEDLLVARNYLPVGYISTLPKNKEYFNQSRYSLVLYNCTPTGKYAYALYWYLSAPTPEDTASKTNVITKCEHTGWISSSMKAARIITLN